ncbi:MAG TPA: hypothetical protein PKK23_02215 [Nitrospirales bacterium]|nr:hypothetical protein [Nitrospiraceae bacterium]HNP27831.1 hypothetical protein [Nitrospirales bacterium]
MKEGNSEVEDASPPNINQNRMGTTATLTEGAYLQWESALKAPQKLMNNPGAGLGREAPLPSIPE